MKDIFFQTKKEKQFFAAFSVLAFLFCLLYGLWHFFIRKEEPIMPVLSPSHTIIQQYGVENFDFSLFENPQFKEMIIFEEITMPEEFGREKPFEPF